jgi:hypothetical protein
MSKKQTVVENKYEANGFVRAKSAVYYRKGAKAPWIEILFVQESGAEVKLIAKKVSKFYTDITVAETEKEEQAL